MKTTAIGLAFTIVIIFVGALTAAVPVNLVGTWSTGLTHTVGAGNNRILIFTAGWEEMQALSDRPIASVSYGGRAMTQIIRQTQPSHQGVEIWYLKESDIMLASGSSFSVSWLSGVPGVIVHYAAATYANVDQTNPVISFSSAATPNGLPNPLTTTVNVVADGYALAIASHGKGNGGFTWNNGWTSQTEQLASVTLTGTGDHAETVDGISTASVTKLSTTSNRFVLAAVSLSPVTGPVGPNEPPVLAPVAAQVVDEGINLTFGLTATDADGTIPVLSATGLPSGSAFTDNSNGSGSFSWTPGFSQSGVYSVKFFATDGIDTDSTATTITVNNVNRPPLLATIGPKTGVETVLLSFGVSASDPDGTTPLLLASPLPGGALFTDNLNGTGTFDWTPTSGQAGTYNVKFFASDGLDSDSESVTITINATNQAPVLAAIGAQSGDEGALLTIGVSATDGDGTIPSLSAAVLPTGATFTDNLDGNGSLSWTPNFTQAGSYSVTFYATDGIDSDSEVVAITINNVNQAPSLASIGSKSVVQGTNLNFGLTAFDPDGTTPLLTAGPLPGGALFTDNLNGTGIFDWTPALAQVGTHSVTFIASDGFLADSETVTITVSDAPPPTTAIVPVGSWSTGLTHTVGVGNNRLLVFTVGWEEKRAGGDRPIASVSYGGRAMTQIIRQTQPSHQGVEIWYLKESDIVLASGSNFSVSWLSGVPGVIVQYAAATYANVDQTTPVISFSSAASPNGQPNPITTTVNVVADGYALAIASHGKGNGGFTWNNGWTSQTEQLASATLTGTGDHAETVDGTTTASVTKLSTTNNRFVLAAVSLSPVTGPVGPNEPPVLAPVAAQVVDEGVNLTFGLTATDADGTIPVLSATGLPSGSAFTDNGNGSGSFSWTPGFSQSGVYSVKFFASDGIDIDSTAATITVNNINRPPLLAAIGSKIGIETVQLSFGVSASDPDGTTPALSTSSLPTGATFLDNGNGTGTFDWTPAAGQAATYNVKFFASDGMDSDSELVTITINATNQAPVLAAIGAQSGDEGALLTISVTATDGDGMIPSLSAGVLPPGATFTDNLDGSGSFNWAPSFAQGGSYSVTFYATDGIDSDSEVVAITINDVNQPPSLALIGSKSVVQGTNLNFGLTAFDPDGTTPLLSASPLPGGALFTDNLNGTGTFDWTPTLAQVGTHGVVFVASDGTLVDSETVTITVSDTPPADQVRLLDVNTDNTLSTSWTVNNISAGNNRIMVWTVAHENRGLRTEDSVKLGGKKFTKLAQVNTSDASLNLDMWYLLEADIAARSDDIVSDHRTGSSSSESECKSVLVYENVDQNNPFNGFAVDTTTSSSAKRPMTASVDVLGGGVVVTLFGEGSAVTATWNNGFTKRTDITATSNSLYGSSADKLFLTSQTASVSVDASPQISRHGLIVAALNPSVPPGPQTPVLAAIGPRTVVESTNLNFVVTASDADGTTPSLTASPLPTGSSFLDNLDGTGTFDWTPVLAQVGIYSVTFAASDGSLADSEVVSITVLDTPPPTTAITPVGAWSTGLTHTVGAGNNRLLIFSVGWEEKQANPDRPLASVTFGGISLTHIVRQTQPAYQAVELWYLDEVGIQAASGSNFSVAWSLGAPTVIVQYASAVYENVNQTSPVISFSSAASPDGQPNPLTTTVNVVADGYAVAVASHGKGDGGFAWNNGWTSRTEQLASATLTGTGDHAETVSGTSTASVTKLATTGNRFVLAAVSLAPASGVKIVTRPDAGDNSAKKNIPTDYRLYDNSPNPFNPVTLIRFDLPVASQVRLDVYNVLGRKVATLLNGYRAAGEYSVRWDAGHLGSGLYLYRLHADDFVATSKMVLMK